MKRISIFIVLFSALFLGITNVNADAEGKLYGISTYANSIKENQNIYEEYEEFQLANGSVYVKGSSVSINNLSNAEYISVENYSGNLGMTLNITLSGNNTVDAFKWNGFSGKINISGSGSLKFKPVSGVGTTEIPSLENGGVPYYYVEGVEEQKNEVARIIQTSLPISYVDGYVCINCNVESPKEEYQPAPTTPDTPTISDNESNPNEEKEYVKKIISNEGIEFSSKDNLDSTYKLVTKDITSNYSDLKLEKNLELIQVYDITVQSKDNKIVEMKNGEYLIKFKLTEKMKEYKNISIVYLKDGEIKEAFDTSKDDNYLSFTTTHLSEYGIVGSKDAQKVEINVSKNTKKQQSNLGFIIGGIVLSIAVIASVTFVYLKVRKK